MNRLRLLVTFAVGVLLIGRVQADHLEVRRAVPIKGAPFSAAPTVRSVTAGTLLDLLDDGLQSNGYYHVVVPDSGQRGWVYRSFVRRHPGSVPTTVATATDPLADPTLSLTDTQRQFAARHLRIGKPQAVYERAREGYVLALDARLKIPLWVQYELTREMLTGPATRTDDFRPDTSIPAGARAEPRDYVSSGLDRGHMAPAGDMTRSTVVMSESFLLSNMAPQVGVGFNRHIWAGLEAAVRGWVEQRGTLVIITGPVFMPEDQNVSYRVIGPGQVAVPTHFYKIVVDTNDPQDVQALAFLMPNTSLTGRDLAEFLASINEIEALTGLNFLSALPQSVQAGVEATTATGLW